MSKNDSVDKDLDYLEEEFLNCKIEDIPIPNDDINDLEDEVEEVMKSGCNRQIAEYVIIKYKELKDEENGELKLIKYKKNYLAKRNDYFEEIKNNINIYKKNSEEVKKYYNENIIKGYETKEDIFDSYISDKLKDYDEEIKQFQEYCSKNTDIKSNDNANLIRYNLYKNLYMKNDKEKDEKTKNFLDEREKYITKRDAIIESCLRHVKKIVNNEEEYNKFYKEYKEYSQKNKEKNKGNN